MSRQAEVTDTIAASRPEPAPSAAPHGPAGKRGLETRPEFYLLYLIFYFTPWFFQAPPQTDLLIGLAAAIAYIPFYLFVMHGGAPRLALGAAVSLALSLALTPLSGMSGCYAIYAVTTAAAIRPARGAAIAIAVIAPVYLIGSVLLEASVFEIMLTGFISIMAGAGTLAGFNTAERTALREQALQLEAELAAVRERERIARDLHDVLGHTLTTIAVKSDLAVRLMEIDAQAAKREVSEIRDAARTSLRDVRAAVAGMHATTLAAELERARPTLQTAGVALTVDGDAPTLEARADTALGLAVREAVTNIIRHSGARRAQITLSRQGPQARIEIEDDGGGAAPVEGEGLTGMRRRLEALGGGLKTGRGRRGVRLELSAPAQSRLETS